MKNLITICVVSLSMTLAGTSNADLSYSDVSANGELIIDPGITLTDVYSESSAHIELLNGMYEYEWLYDDAAATDTSASLAFGSTNASGSTTYLNVAVHAYTAPPPNVWGHVEVYANQKWGFEVDAAGMVTFNLNYYFDQDLWTAVSGESAGASSRASIVLYDAFDAFLDEASFNLNNTVENGGSGTWPDYSGTLSLMREFAEDDLGYVEFGVSADAGAHTVPAPGAILLGILGLGVAGVKLRKFI